MNKSTQTTFPHKKQMSKNQYFTQKTTNYLNSNYLQVETANTFCSVDLETPKKLEIKYNSLHIKMKFSQLRKELYNLQMCQQKNDLKNFLMKCSSTIVYLLQFYMKEFFICHVISKGMFLQCNKSLLSMRRVL